MRPNERRSIRHPPRKRPMTVCIAAVCNMGHDDGPAIIAASDRMITMGELEYEPDQAKCIPLASRTLGLLAGDMELHAHVVPIVQRKVLDAIKEDPSNINVGTVAAFYAEEFAYYRRTLAEREILIPRGLDFERFYNRQSIMAHYQVKEIDDTLTSYLVNSSAIVAGLDQTGAHIYKIENPGVARCWDTSFFACIGSGENMASTQFIVSGFEKRWTLPRAAWLVFSAKAKAESSGGVGRKTDLFIIRKEQQIESLNDSDKDKLYDIFKKTTEKERLAAEDAETEVRSSINLFSCSSPSDVRSPT
jgi:20S proteasome alpha/beta subunit